MKIEFTPTTDFGKIIQEWWVSLQDDPGSRAELRRCNSIEDVVMTPTYQRLYNSKFRKHIEQAKVPRDRMAAVVGLLSHLKHDVSNASGNVDLFASQMAKPVSADRALVSELRFRRLLQHDKRDDLYPAMIRIIRMLKGSASLYGIAESVFFWGEKMRKTWAYAYFSHAK